jgi:hypothetical protein
MRPKVVIPMLLVAAGLLVIIVLASKMLQPRSTSLAENTAVSVPPTNLVKVVKTPVVISKPVFYTAPMVVANDPAEHTQYVRQQIKELNALSWNNDDESRDAILSEVATNSDKQIRAAALEAAIQFDDRSVVPRLQEIAAQTDDPEEKKNILDAIDYINLPSLTEYLAANPSTLNAPRRSSPHNQAPNTSPPDSSQ